VATNGTKTEGGNAQGFVTVALKSTAGLVLQGYHWESQNEPVMGGGYREVKVAVKNDDESFSLVGTAAPQGLMPQVPVVGGYAINKGVPAALWEKWLEQHKSLPIVKEGLIFAYANRDDAEARANEHAKKRTGLERLAPE
jgi:hypothetical protein